MALMIVKGMVKPFWLLGSIELGPLRLNSFSSTTIWSTGFSCGCDIKGFGTKEAL